MNSEDLKRKHSKQDSVSEQKQPPLALSLYKIVNILDVNVDLFEVFDFAPSSVSILPDSSNPCLSKKERRQKRLKDKKFLSKRTHEE
jgi:hypothetical protein